MLTDNISFKRADRSVEAGNFYPIHLTKLELLLIIEEVLQTLANMDEGLIKISVRKDKGGKGIDLKLEKLDKRPHQIRKDRQYTFGINANWNLVDFFDHYTHHAGAIRKVVAGKEYLYKGFIADEMIGFQLETPDKIYRSRSKYPEPLLRNPLFEHDNWSCLFQHYYPLTEE